MVKAASRLYEWWNASSQSSYYMTRHWTCERAFEYRFFFRRKIFDNCQPSLMRRLRFNYGWLTEVTLLIIDSSFPEVIWPQHQGVKCYQTGAARRMLYWGSANYENRWQPEDLRESTLESAVSINLPWIWPFGRRPVWVVNLSQSPAQREGCCSIMKKPNKTDRKKIGVIALAIHCNSCAQRSNKAPLRLSPAHSS